MPSLEYFLVAESVSVDQFTDRVSLFNVLEEIQFEQLPGQIPQFVVVSTWNFDPGEETLALHLTLVIHSPNSAPEPRRHDFLLEQSNTRRRRALMGFIGFTFSQPGAWRFELLKNGEHCATHTLTILAAVPDESGRLADSSFGRPAVQDDPPNGKPSTIEAEK